jgi:CrcB protein
VTALLVALGAAVGAPLRYLLDRGLQTRLGSAFPWGTFAVNITGSLLLGAITGAGIVSPAVLAAVGTGFCGALTTYSTFGWEAVHLPGRHAVAYVMVSTAAGLGAAALGWLVGGALG